MNDTMSPRSTSPPGNLIVKPATSSIAVHPPSKTSSESTSELAVTTEVSGDNEAKAETRQKRKRTNPQDQAILEAEFKQNPKPSKATRAEIVRKVDLNEREVQIWFQNRRQIQRRKSQPLLPHEISALGLGRLPSLSSDPASTATSSSQDDIRPGSLKESSDQSLERPSQSTALDQDHGMPQSITIEDNATAFDKMISGNQSLVASETGVAIGNGNDNGSSSNADGKLRTSFSSTPGYLSNRRNIAIGSVSALASSKSNQDNVAIMVTSQSSCPERDPSLISLSSGSSNSRVRLSMSLEGRAQLVATDPSPPRAAAIRLSSANVSLAPKPLRTLQRSQSALTSPQLNSVSSSHVLIPCLPRGRSRDARTWEFCCDPDARDELTTQAENESSGSAVAAISLIRSTSNNARKFSTNKRNAPSKPSSEVAKKRAKLVRAQSSLARLQSNILPMKASQETKIKNASTAHSPSGDSDKENWVPTDVSGTPRRRRPLPSSSVTSKAVLSDQIQGASRSSLLCPSDSGSKNKKQASETTDIYEDRGGKESPCVPGDVEDFMRGEISPSKKGDLDCIKGLLSLSQGNWR